MARFLLVKLYYNPGSAWEWEYIDIDSIKSFIKKPKEGHKYSFAYGSGYSWALDETDAQRVTDY